MNPELPEENYDQTEKETCDDAEENPTEMEIFVDKPLQTYEGYRESDYFQTFWVTFAYFFFLKNPLDYDYKQGWNEFKWEKFS